MLKVGLIADTHMPGTIDALWSEVMDLFSDVDVILHAGDLHTLSVVDELSALAPVYVARGNGDVGIVDDRLQEAWVLPLGSFSIGMIHHFPSPERKTSQQLHKYMQRHFRSVPDVVVYGHTHLEAIHDVDGVLCVNPGSPTLPRNQSLRYGHVGIMELGGDKPSVTLYELFEGGARTLGA
ncbi:MAG: YfcE family phosphodiesterase [Gammaproteobacteria bacterium]|nr:YfcE family phosphodiesterase [Gammaproteobacteria bacterium]RPG23976.1 MAG: YfcE family phosphodiesterase [Gammaproteobacteria bacterium TMED50]